MMSALLIDRAFAKLIPPLSSEELWQLENNLLADGCRDPLAIWKGKGILLDGHNRLAICKAKSIPYDTVEVAFQSRDEAKAWIINNQLGRRNLPPYARAELALKLESIIRAKAKAKQAQAGKNKLLQKSVEAINTQKELAKRAGVSHDTLAKAKVIEQKADEQTKRQLREGKMSINAAHNRIKDKSKRRKKHSTLSNRWRSAYGRLITEIHRARACGWCGMNRTAAKSAIQELVRLVEEDVK